MTSQRKFKLRIFELLAGFGGLVIPSMMYYLKSEVNEPDLGVLLVISSLSFAIVVSFVSLDLWEEYAKVIRGRSYDSNSENSLSLSEIRGLVRWSPTAFTLAHPLAVLFGLGAFWWYFIADSSSGSMKTTNIAVGLMSLANAFLLISLPILASASRMPGAFRDNFVA